MQGDPIFELETPLTRIQALILTIRLLGLEEEALAFEGENPFTDVPDWAVPYAAYGYDVGITNGISTTEFGPNLLATCQQFTAFMLRVLGYNEKLGDFEYVDTLAYALVINLYTSLMLDEFGEGDFLRADAVIAMVNALLSLIKDSGNTKLIDTLIAKGVLTEEAVNEFIANIARINEFFGLAAAYLVQRPPEPFPSVEGDLYLILRPCL